MTENNNTADSIFDSEQAHLTWAYDKLTSIYEQARQAVSSDMDSASQDMDDLYGEKTLDYAETDTSVETMIELESINNVVDAYNRVNDANVITLRRARQLMRQPYFAKVSLQFKPGEEPRDIYLGSAGMTDEKRRHFIVDWRSPVAETYYNQENGPMSYEADGRTINVDLKLRRQFDITRDRLNAYFDTTVAIEDPLLLASLSSERSDKMKAITATIQKEQNQVVRHKDVPVLLVNGIAGSGKTSVLLQRIAFLFYRQRNNLRPDQVYLLTPNPVFERYIDQVLPDMGERNPQIITWRGFIRDLGLAEHGFGGGTDDASLRAIEDGLADLRLEPQDFRDIRVNDVTLIKAQQIQNTMMKHRNVPTGPRLIGLMKEDLHDKLDSRLAQLPHDQNIQDEMLHLDVDEQTRIFGEVIVLSEPEDRLNYARRYVEAVYAGAHDDIEAASWLRFDRIGMRMLGKGDLSSVEWLYLKTMLTGEGERDARYVMIDEVQDYTPAQLMCLARYFGNAHFLLLGDEHQAIRENTATFSQIKDVFSHTHGEVSECRLLTSYRSSPEITELFTSLMDADERAVTSSVQRPGVDPRIESFEDETSYLAALHQVVTDAREDGKLTAVVAADKRRMRWLAKQLGDDVQVMDDDVSLPAHGVVLMDLPLAKGLEFDRVIVPDAQAEVYPDTQLARNRLYTAISRATYEVHILAEGRLTPLLTR
jgi:DNA helicase-2/ATP-dependent DNA helicase PcrA